MSENTDKIKVLYEDNHIIVVEKPVNILSQADETGDADMLSLVKAYIKDKYQKPGDVFLGLVHRLDRPVGGVMVFARTSKAASRLSEQIRSRSFKKTYLAVVHDVPVHIEHELRDYLKKDERINTVRVVSPDVSGSKEAVLEYKVIGTSGDMSLLSIKLHTGRPHQIRVQLSNMGHPLYGDQKYGQAVNKVGQQIALWSAEIILSHPTLKEEMVFKSSPPDRDPWIRFKE